MVKLMLDTMQKAIESISDSDVAFADIRQVEHVESGQRREREAFAVRRERRRLDQPRAHRALLDALRKVQQRSEFL